MQKDEIIIRNAIVHILETAVGMPVLSEYLLERNEEINDLIRGHIYKIASGDDLKSCVFAEEGSGILELVRQFTEETMVAASCELANQLYEIMRQNPDIPSADLLVATYQYEGRIFLALLKLNYKTSFIHMTANAEDGSNYNDIIRQCATLPQASSRLSEAVLIDLKDYSIQIVEKKYEVNGEKVNYLSELYLNCHARMSQKTKMGIVTRAVEQINKKYFDDEIEMQMKAKSIIQNEIAEQGVLNPVSVSEKIYEEYPTIKEEFEEKLEKYNLAKEEVRPQSEATVKKFQTQFLKTDTGIEINIPMDQYNHNDNVEFLTNPDGTISIVIKNINRIISK